jgi:hypothetical protein
VDHHARRDRALLRKPAKRHDPGLRLAHRSRCRDAGSQSAECRKGCEPVRATGDAKNQDLLSRAATREWADCLSNADVTGLPFTNFMDVGAGASLCVAQRSIAPEAARPKRHRVYFPSGRQPARLV